MRPSIEHRLRTCLVVIAVLTLTLAGTAAPVGAASVMAIPAVEQGTFRFIASDFEDDEEVSTWVTGPHDQVQDTGVFEANSEGDASFTIRLPRHFEPGRWAITVYGLTSDRQAIGYFWMPDLGPNAPLTVAPEEAARGAIFTFSGSGFDAFEQVDFWPTGPSGTAYEGGQTTARSDGSIAFSFVFGQESETGQWSMSAYGMRSGRLGVVQFAVT